MNLIEIQKRAEYNRLISMIICVLLVLTIFVIDVDYTYANPVIGAAVVLDGASVYAAYLNACGYTGLTAVSVDTAWDSLTPAQQAAFVVAGQNAKVASNNYAMADVNLTYGLSVAEFRELDTAFINAYGDGMIEIYYNLDPWKEFAVYAASGPLTFQQTTYPMTNESAAIMAKVTTLINAGNKVIVTTFRNQGTGGDRSLFNGADKVYVYYTTGEFNFIPNDTNTIRCYATAVFKRDSFSNLGNGIWGWSEENFTMSSPNYFTLSKTTGSRYYYSNLPVRYSNTVGSALLGYMFYGTVVDYSFDSFYSPATNPLPEDTQGEIHIRVPFTDAPDTNISVPANNSISNPITLQTIIDGYGSIDGFFESGGVITLSDGTRISSTSEATRAEGWEDAYPSADEEPWVYDIPILGDILQWLIKIWNKLADILSSIGTWFVTLLADLANPFNWEKNPKGPGFLEGIGGFFAVLLALLLAIMHLIVKVIAFIGQLYTIPASSAMLHPTMIQGIEWARGFESGSGVNLYGLITGVISIVLGIVCFKLLRKLITGIGTASFIEEKETLPTGTHRTGGW